MYDIASRLKSLQNPIAILDSHLEKSSKRKQLIDETFKDNFMLNLNPTALSKSNITTEIYRYDETTTTVGDGSSHFESRLKHFMEILDVLKNPTDGREIQLLFLSMTATGPIHEAATELFSLLLHSWHSSYGLRVKMGQLDESFYDGNCGSFDQIMSFIKYSTEDNLHAYAITCEKKEKAVQINKETKRILFTTYFTNKKRFSIKSYRENSFQFVKGFVVTAKRYNAHMVVYYDQIDPSYEKRLLTFYPNIEFIQYTGDFYKKTINDARFFIMYDYLKEHPEIDRIILQDLRDGIYLTDPFEVMELAGDYVYVGEDMPFYEEFHKDFVLCEEKHKDLFTRPRPYPMLNAGTLGGTRHMVMGFLEELIKSFNEIFPLHLDCNMDVVDYVAHKFFKDVMYTGYPFQGCMQIGLASPPGMAIRHKRTKYDM